MPYILFKYISKQFAYYFFAILIVIASIILLFDFIELVRMLHSKNIPLYKVLQLGVLKNFDRLQRVIPFVGLISSVVLYAKMTKNNELAVMRSAGLSIWHFLAPSLAAMIFIGFINITIFNPITVYLLAKYEKVESYYLKGQTSFLALSPTGLWIKQDDDNNRNSILHALRVVQLDKELFDVTFYNTDESGGFIERIDASKAVLNDGEWKVYNAVIMREKHDIEAIDELSIPTNLSFRQIQESVIAPETISFWQLPRFIEIAEKSGLSAIKHKLYFFKILMLPFFMASLVLIGSSFAMSMPRQGNTGRLTMTGIMAGFFVYFISDVIFAYGLSGKIPIIISAASPTLLCLVLGLYLHLHREDL